MFIHLCNFPVHNRETVSNWLLLGALGRFYGALPLLVRSWPLLSRSLVFLGRSWLLLGALVPLLGALGLLLGALGELLGPSWDALGEAPGRPGLREAGNGPGEGSGGFRLRRPKTNGTRATGEPQSILGIQAAPPTPARGYQDLKILDPRH